MKDFLKFIWALLLIPFIILLIVVGIPVFIVTTLILVIVAGWVIKLKKSRSRYATPQKPSVKPGRGDFVDIECKEVEPDNTQSESTEKAEIER
jgi:hypothetical protein